MFLLVGGLLIRSTEGAVQGVAPAPEQQRTQWGQIRSPRQQAQHMVQNGIPYMRAVTRLISDTPESMGAQSQQGQRTDGIIQKEMSRHRDHGIEYGRAATLSVDTDRVPVCQAENFRTQEGKKRVSFEDRESKVEGDRETTGRIKEELRIWSLNVRSIGTEHKLKELHQEAEQDRNSAAARNVEE